jgi:PAS domain S-box-containing protein
MIQVELHWNYVSRSRRLGVEIPTKGVVAAMKDHGKNQKELMCELEDLRLRVGILEQREIHLKREMDLLRASEARFRQTVEASPNAILSLDENCFVLAWNQSCVRVTGLFRDEITGKDFISLCLNPSEAHLLRETVAEVFQGKAFSGLEFQFIGAEGATTSMVSRAYPVVDGQGRVVECVLANTDVTGLKRTEQALRESEEQFRAIYENAPVMIDAFSPEGTPILWNNEMEKQLGWTKEEALSRDILATCYPDPEVCREVREIVKHADGKFREFTPITKSGAQRTQLWANFPLLDGKIIAVGYDITELKRSQLDLALQKQRFEVLSKHAPFGLAMLAEDGTYLYVNPKFTEMFGYNLKDIPNGRQWFRRSFPDPKYRHEVISLWKQDLSKAESGEILPRTFRVTCKDGSEKLIHFRPVQLETGDHLVTCEDVTARQRAEEELENALKRSSQLRAEAQAASRAKSRFLAGMSHEIRTPLNAVIGFSEILEDQTYGELNEKQLRFVGYILESSQHLLRLISDVLDLAKIESGKMALQARWVDLHQLLQSSLLMIKESASKHSIQLDLQVEEALEDMSVYVDDVKLKQIMFNLLSNAVKFTPDNGRIVLDVQRKNESLIISVSDTGAGFRIADKERIFDAFEQLDSQDCSKGEGTGLGLALTRRMVELHGGHIWAESEGPGKGSIFKFTIPLAKPE